MPRQSKRYCFTWNNYSAADRVLLEAFFNAECKYLVYGREVGAAGTPHLQGFFTLKDKKSVVALRKPPSSLACHLEATKGTSVQAADYCKKGTGTPEAPVGADVTEFGDVPTAGKRTDLDAAVAVIQSGGTIVDVAAQHPRMVVRYGRGLRDLSLLLAQPYNHDSVRGTWIWGVAGGGKSHRAREMYPTAFMKAQSKWFDGYAQQTSIILDDLDSTCLGHYLKIWADKYSCVGETKGGTVNLQHRAFVVTSNYSIESLWADEPEMCAAILRRFNVIEITEVWASPRVRSPDRPSPPHGRHAEELGEELGSEYSDSDMDDTPM